MLLIVGLGNPGDKYQKTRHNTGFMAIDKIKETYSFPDFEFSKKFNAYISSSSNPLLPLVGEGGSALAEPDEGQTSNDNKIILAKPHTMMNDSGETVRSILDFYKLSPEDIIVIHDDIDLTLGKYKISADSGSAGHNGVEDIISKIGTKNFKRIRIGIANEDLRTKIDPSDFVLQNFSDEELKIIETISKNIIEEIKNIF